MNGLLIVNGFLHTDKFRELTQMFQSAAKELSIQLDVKENSEVLVEVGGKQDGRCVSADGCIPDFVLFWDKDILLARWLEDMGIPVHNSAGCIALCDDKRKMHLALQRRNIKVPETFFAPMTYSGIGFAGSYAFLDSIEEKLGYPLVVKEAYGSFGAQVYLAGNRGELEKIIHQCHTSELLFQRFVAASRGRDIRIQVVGGRVIGSMYRYSDSDFRANITAGGSMKPYEPSEEEKKLAILAAEAVGADFAGVDLLFDEDGPVVCEVNSNAHFKNLQECTGVNTAYEILSYLRDRYGSRCKADRRHGYKNRYDGWLIYDREGARKNSDYIRMHRELGRQYGIHFTLKDACELERECKDGLTEKPDFAIVRAICPALSKQLEQSGILVCNNAFVSEICNDKGKTVQFIEENTDVPVIPTTRFCNGRLSKDLLREYPNGVIKAVDGHGGAQVFRTNEPFEKICRGIGDSDFVIQPFVEGPGKDVRVYIIGGEIVGAIERKANDGFRSNFSLGGSVRNYFPSPKEIGYVKKICGLFSFAMAGIDFLMDANGQLIFNEIEDVVGARMLYRCNPDIPFLEKYFAYIVDRLLQ